MVFITNTSIYIYECITIAVTAADVSVSSKLSATADADKNSKYFSSTIEYKRKKNWNEN